MSGRFDEAARPRAPATALALAREGAKVVVAARREAECAALVEPIALAVDAGHTAH